MLPGSILRTIERLGHKMEFEGSTANVTVAGLALAVLRVDHEFNGMAFSIRSYEEVTTPEVSVAQGAESQAARLGSRASFRGILRGRQGSLCRDLKKTQTSQGGFICDSW
jgi:hypothetical protein